MLGKRKNYGAPAGGLILAGLAAFAYYKYSRLSADERQDLVNNLKEKGKKFMGQFTGKMEDHFQDQTFQNGSHTMG